MADALDDAGLRAMAKCEMRDLGMYVWTGTGYGWWVNRRKAMSCVSRSTINTTKAIIEDVRRRKATCHQLYAEVKIYIHTALPRRMLKYMYKNLFCFFHPLRFRSHTSLKSSPSSSSLSLQWLPHSQRSQELPAHVRYVRHVC